ncbi:hypothetical protein MSG28_000793 [Choristoneura fumiferana]|uniref:Uncharacterized protein n=1 Tax=Choristoneura fumiferana TaxID=7141 RepID=A0ACC0K256_CHOFU|nr:hypothetical protein MSG28_000793 [Choristoneura fumiferana]
MKRVKLRELETVTSHRAKVSQGETRLQAVLFTNGSKIQFKKQKRETSVTLFISNGYCAVPERVEPGSQLTKNGNLEQNGEVVKPPDKTTATSTAMQHTEVTALHMEVDTLRWQLEQTEANRQMHIALLNQIVTFLNKVKDHIECKKTDSGSKDGIPQARVLLRSFNSADLPRSKSVVHVNKHLEYSLNPPKRFGTRKISQSISNVNGYKDCTGTW